MRYAGGLALVGSQGASSSTRRPARDVGGSRDPSLATDPGDGAVSEMALLERAQRALQARDREALVRLIAPEVRRAWLAGLLVELAAETTETPSRDLEHRRVRAELRAAMIEHGAYVASRPAELRPESLGRAMLARVVDDVALYGALLTIADARRAPLDPVRAVVGGGATTASAAPLLRLVRRIEAPAKLVEAAVEGGSAVFVDGPSGRAVVRVRRDGGRVWLDES